MIAIAVVVVILISLVSCIGVFAPEEKYPPLDTGENYTEIDFRPYELKMVGSYPPRIIELNDDELDQKIRQAFINFTDDPNIVSPNQIEPVYYGILSNGDVLVAFNRQTEDTISSNYRVIGKYIYHTATEASEVYLYKGNQIYTLIYAYQVGLLTDKLLDETAELLCLWMFVDHRNDEYVVETTQEIPTKVITIPEDTTRATQNSQRATTQPVTEQSEDLTTVPSTTAPSQTETRAPSTTAPSWQEETVAPTQQIVPTVPVPQTTTKPYVPDQPVTPTPQPGPDTPYDPQTPTIEPGEDYTQPYVPYTPDYPYSPGIASPDSPYASPDEAIATPDDVPTYIPGDASLLEDKDSIKTGADISFTVFLLTVVVAMGFTAYIIKYTVLYLRRKKESE